MKAAPVIVVGVGLAVAAAALLADRAEPGKPPRPNSAPVTVCTPAPDVVCDALDSSRGQPTYRRVEVPTLDCLTAQSLGDGGVRRLGQERVLRADAGRLVVLADSCVPASTVAGPRILDGGVRYAAQACFCRRASGACTVSLEDGGTAPAPFGKTVRNASGPGCVPKACVELLGVSSWPPTCPGG